MITIVTAAWQRPKRLELCLMNWKALNPMPVILVATSPNDDETVRLCQRYGALHFTCPNEPLGAKWNNATQTAGRQHPSDYYLILGSDDLISQKLWDYYNSYSGDYTGLLDFYFHNLTDKRTLHWKGFDHRHKSHIGEPIGAGKLISHQALERTGFRPFNDKLSRTLDYQVHRSLIDTGSVCNPISLTQIGGVAMDLKTSIGPTRDQPKAKDGGNLNRFKRYDNSEYVSLSNLAVIAPDVVQLIEKYNSL